MSRNPFCFEQILQYVFNANMSEGFQFFLLKHSKIAINI